jgi:hypothetical protein
VGRDVSSAGTESGGEIPDDAVGEATPTYGGIIRLPEEIRRDVAAMR